MSHITKDLVNQRVCYHAVGGEYTVEETRVAVAELVEWLDTGADEQRYMIFDAEELVSFPVNVMEMHKALSPLFSHKRLGETVVFGKGDKIVVRFFVNSVVPLFGHSVKMVSNYGQAVEYLESLHPELIGQFPPKP